MCFVFTFVDYTISTERFLKPITFAQILYPSLTKLILPFAIRWNCRDRDVTWLPVPGAEHFPGNTGFGQCWIFVDRRMCGIYAFCRRGKEGYLFFIFPISCFFVHDVFTHMVFAARELSLFFLIQIIAFQCLVKWAWGSRQMGGEARLEAMEWVIGLGFIGLQSWLIFLLTTGEYPADPAGLGENPPWPSAGKCWHMSWKKSVCA